MRVSDFQSFALERRSVGDRARAVSFWTRAYLYKTLAGIPVTRRHAGRAFSRLCNRVDLDLTCSHWIAGRPVLLDLRCGTDRSIFLHGAADLRGVRAIQGVMKRLSPRTAWDVGANRGNHSAFIRKYCRRLICFEPNPSEAQRLRALFEHDGAVEVVEAALSDSTGAKSFFIDDIESGNSTLEVGTVAPNAQVEAVTGDKIAAEFAIRDLDFMKIDVEGHEASVLRGIKKTLHSQRPVIMFEVLEAQSKPENIGDLLPKGYDLYGNRRGILSGLAMSAYRFCHFEYGRTFMCAIAIPNEKKAALAALLPKPV